jgi:hypothetical protein
VGVEAGGRAEALKAEYIAEEKWTEPLQIKQPIPCLAIMW